MMWRGPTFVGHYGAVDLNARELLNKEDSRYLLNVDFDEYLDHLISLFAWEPLRWDEEAMTVEPYTVKETTQGYRPHTVEHHKFRLRIPLSPHPNREDYFKFGPSRLSSRWEQCWKFEDNVLIVEVDATKESVEQALPDVRFWLGGRNKDIEEGNAGLRERLRPVWETKRRQLEGTYGALDETIKRLSIPLYRDPNAKVKPIEIKPRKLRTAAEKPKARASEPEPTLNHDDVVELVGFIEGYAREFEVTPRPFSKMSEEELRDLLVGMMNANYPGSTTAETFNKLGKTDISFRVNSRHILVCECKFWSGAKAYAEALEQLFGYLTWRQNYGVLIHFCKAKDMSKAVAAAKAAMTTHPTFIENSPHLWRETRFSARHLHPQDPDKAVEIHHIFIDLSVS